MTIGGLMYTQDDFADPVNSILLAPGNKAIFRYAAKEVPAGWRMATSEELCMACFGYPFPWGRMPDASKASEGWKKGNQRMGVGGLFHRSWYKTKDGRRYGGASNVPDTFPGSLRCNLRFGGGECPSDQPEENEGYAIIKEFCGVCVGDNVELYRAVQRHALEHVTADGGETIISPIGENGLVYVGFVGRCLWCPNALDISFRQLKKHLLENGYNHLLELYPEWRR